ncbi:MAG: hypothetical protein ACYTBS_04110, partial [Planctomycetota bacterium]
MSDRQTDQSRAVGWAIHLPMLSMSHDPISMGSPQDALRRKPAHPTTLGTLLAIVIIPALCANARASDSTLTINKKDTGYRGIWYMNQPSGDEYVYKYSGGLGTYCAKHKPFAVYCDEVKKTFFCYG